MDKFERVRSNIENCISGYYCEEKNVWIEPDYAFSGMYGIGRVIGWIVKVNGEKQFDTYIKGERVFYGHTLKEAKGWVDNNVSCESRR